jgi:hypothetical protein
MPKRLTTKDQREPPKKPKRESFEAFCDLLRTDDWGEFENPRRFLIKKDGARHLIQGASEASVIRACFEYLSGQCECYFSKRARKLHKTGNVFKAICDSAQEVKQVWVSPRLCQDAPAHLPCSFGAFLTHLARRDCGTFQATQRFVFLDGKDYQVIQGDCESAIVRAYFEYLHGGRDGLNSEDARILWEYMRENTFEATCENLYNEIRTRVFEVNFVWGLST